MPPVGVSASTPVPLLRIFPCNSAPSRYSCHSRVLTRRELATVMADLKRASRYANARRNLVIVRLACCCGLRASEIGGLQLDDVVVGVPRPHLRLRRETTKGKRPRMVPLWWDAGTLADLAAGSGGHEVRRMSTGVTILPEPACGPLR